MTFLIYLQIFLALFLIITIVSQRSNSDDVMLNGPGHGSFSAAGTFLRRLTIFLIFCFFVSSLLLARNSATLQKSKKSLISSLEGEKIIQENKAEDINVPVLQ
jgi:protein translocase SecG subunit